MNKTVLERGMLKTRVPERGMAVTTALPPLAAWTAVWRQQPSCRLVWLHMHRRPCSPGGMAEYHEWVVDQVRRGLLPADQEAEAAGPPASCLLPPPAAMSSCAAGRDARARR